jgi:hypothetical protein
MAGTDAVADKMASIDRNLSRLASGQVPQQDGEFLEAGRVNVKAQQRCAIRQGSGGKGRV